jgi:REP element-mobilizing transposase RayT
MANRPPRLDRIFQKYDPPLFFVTFNTRKRAPILANNAVHARFTGFTREADARNIAVGRYVIMPDHIHLFVVVGRDFTLSRWVGMLKRHLSTALHTSSPHWQAGFYDHLLRHEESYSQKWDYVRLNPERAGLVASADQWPYQGEIVVIDRI